MASDRPRLLLVDDEIRILSSLQRALRREGYDIVTADSAREALRLIADGPFDLILSDHKMPGMSGIELFERAEALRPRVPKILITGWTEATSASELERLGICAMLPKPWDDAELKATLRKALAEG